MPNARLISPSSGESPLARDEIVARVVPQVPRPLPTTWDGPAEVADTSAYNAHNLEAYRDVEVPGPPQQPR